jgi:hypothetical protein
MARRYQNSAKSIAQRRRAPLRHGGEAAVKAIQKGQELSGLAAQAESALADELETVGLAEVVRRRTIRLQAAADLFYQAILGANDETRLDHLVRRYGWLQNSALRGWQQVKELGEDQPINAAQVLDAVRGSDERALHGED